jgi:2-C-methyl-D-erythritol 4-phosphate cytidylyltransferase
MFAMRKDVACILLAGGSGSRMVGDQPKQFVRIAGKTILEHSLGALRQHLPLVRIVVTAPFSDVDKVARMFQHDPLVQVIAGGVSRQASTLKGLKALADDAPHNIVIHDGARPILDGRTLSDVMEALEEYEAVDVAIPTADTIIAERDGFIENIPKRKHLLRGQTPQAFRYKDLVSCYRTLGEQKLEQFTDDCGVFLACNPDARVRIVKGSEENIKVTYPIDLILADEMFRLRSQTHVVDKPGIDANGKKILIFGGTQGIGKAMANIMQSAGAQVISRSRENGCDITKETEVQNAINEAAIKMDGIDAVVNTAGLLLNGVLSEQSAINLEWQVAVNFTGALNIARLSYPHLKKSKGTLLLFSSSSYTRGRSGYATYAATKAAIVNLTQGLSEEWEEDDIRVNCIIPGRTDTKMRTDNFINEKKDTLYSPYHVAIQATQLICSSLNGALVRVS